MLLLTAVAFGGQDATGAFEYLPSEEGDLLRHRAQELLQMPRDKRLPLVVQEMKRLVTGKRGEMWTADPERIAGILRKERGAVVELILRALPSAVAEAVREHLPAPTNLRFAREVRPEVLNVVRWKLEECLARDSQGRLLFKFSDVLLLASRDLYTVCDRVGARALAAAVAGLPEEEQAAFYEALRPDQRQLAARAAAAAAARALSPEDSRALLAMHDTGKGPSEILRSAGAQRLARALIAQSPEFAARVLERHRGDFGQQLGRWIREERARPPKGDGGRTDFVAEFDKLAALGVIDKPVRLPPPKRPAVSAAVRHSVPGSSLPPPPARVGQRPPPSETRMGSRDGESRSDPNVSRVRDPRGEASVVRERGPRSDPNVSRVRDPRSDPYVSRVRDPRGESSVSRPREPARANTGALREADRRRNPSAPAPGGQERRAGPRRAVEKGAEPRRFEGPERRRDPMAERAARQAGVSPSQSGLPRDPIAQRAALRAGVAPARPNPVRKSSVNIPVAEGGAGGSDDAPGGARLIGKPGASKRGKGDPER